MVYFLYCVYKFIKEWMKFKIIINAFFFYIRIRLPFIFVFSQDKDRIEELRFHLHFMNVMNVLLSYEGMEWNIS